MKNRIFLIIFSTLLLGACERVVTQKDIDLAEKYCAEREGVFSIGVTDVHLVKYITCKNGDATDSREAKATN